MKITETEKIKRKPRKPRKQQAFSTFKKMPKSFQKFWNEEAIKLWGDSCEWGMEGFFVCFRQSDMMPIMQANEPERKTASYIVLEYDQSGATYTYSQSGDSPWRRVGYSENNL